MGMWVEWVSVKAGLCPGGTLLLQLAEIDLSGHREVDARLGDTHGPEEAAAVVS